MASTIAEGLANPQAASAEAIAAYREFIAQFPAPKSIVLIQTQLVPEDSFDLMIARNRGYYAYPPVGLFYLAAAARGVNPGIDVRVIDLNYEMLAAAREDGFHYRFWEKRLAEVIDTLDTPAIGVTCMFGSTKPVFLQVAAWLRNRYPEALLLSGGVQATYDHREILETNHCDIVFRKEAEIPFRQFLQSFENPDAPAPGGIGFRHEEHVYDLGDPAAGTAPIDWDIRKFYSLINIKDYHNVGSLAAFSRFNGEEKPFATVLGIRGCRAFCTFCTVRDFNGRGLRTRDVESVIEEIKFLHDEYGIKQIDWLDDDLLYKEDRAVALFKGMAEEVPGMEWICNNGLIAAAVTPEIMEWMVKSGCKALKVGIESGNDEWLKKIRKPTTKRKIFIASDIFKRYPDVFISGNFIIGFPGEIFREMMDTYNLGVQLQWDWASFYICQPLKGTDMFSAFASLGDERCEVESYDKTLNPGRASARGEFGYKFEGANKIARGREIFDLPLDDIPSKEQLKEVWFTFNLVANFLENPNFKPGGRPDKIVRWFESIAHAYPYDASMVAGLARGYKLLGENAKYKANKKRFEDLLAESAYWQKRVEEFPELVDLAG